MARRKQEIPHRRVGNYDARRRRQGDGTLADQVVFVPMTVPGDVVDVQIRNRRRRFMEGTVVRYVHRSPLRVEPFCAHFGVCGGCKWQNLPYAEQLRFKTEQVRDQLARIGKIEVARRPPLPRLGRDAVLPQQAGIHLRTAPLDDLRGDCRRRRHRRRPRAGIPYPQPLRQGARHRKVLVAARAVERAAQRDQSASRSNTAIRSTTSASTRG